MDIKRICNCAIEFGSIVERENDIERWVKSKDWEGVKEAVWAFKEELGLTESFCGLDLSKAKEKLKDVDDAVKRRDGTLIIEKTAGAVGITKFKLEECNIKW